MSGEVTKMCRLCLTNESNNLIVVEEAMKVFDILFLNVNLTISKEPVICKNCVERVLTCFDFKSSCIYTEDHIFPFVSDAVGAKVDLAAIYLSTNGKLVAEDCNICRFCMKCVKKIDTLPLVVLEETNVLTRDILAVCVPEINLDVVKEPVICTACMENFAGYFGFLMNCRDVEEKINKNVNIERANIEGHVQLTNVLEFLSQNFSSLIAQHIQIKRMLMKACDTGNGERGDMEIKTKNSVQIEKQELIIKDEEFKEDVESNDSDSCQKEANENSKVGVKREMRIYKCDLCTYQTKRKQRFNCHTITHLEPSQTTMYKCQMCSFQSKHKCSLYRHAVNHKEPSEIRFYRCHICAYRTNQKCNLDKHMLIHNKSTETATYKCHLCVFQTVHKRSIQYHVLHHMKSPVMYKCHVCEYQTKQRKRFKDHVLIHNPASTHMA